MSSCWKDICYKPLEFEQFFIVEVFRNEEEAPLDISFFCDSYHDNVTHHNVKPCVIEAQ